MLFMANNQAVTNRLKARIWEKITAKISVCGMAQHPSQRAKDEWKALKGEVLNRQKNQRKTGGRLPDIHLPYEELITKITGENTNLYTGIDGKPTAFILSCKIATVLQCNNLLFTLFLLGILISWGIQSKHLFLGWLDTQRDADPRILWSCDRSHMIMIK